jgi:hypothetical protein
MKQPVRTHCSSPRAAVREHRRAASRLRASRLHASRLRASRLDAIRLRAARLHACSPRSLRRAATVDDTLRACLFASADMPARTKCVAYVLRALMIMTVISSDEMAAVHPEPASFNGKRRLPRTTSDLAYESKEHNSRRIQAPRFRANPGKTMPCRALRTVPRNAQRPRPQIFTACQH